MQRIVIILISLTYIQMWVDWIQSFPFKPLQKLRLSILDFKPFNCALCLSVWIGLILSLSLLDPLYLVLPLLNKLTERIIY